MKTKLYAPPPDNRIICDCSKNHGTTRSAWGAFHAPSLGSACLFVICFIVRPGQISTFCHLALKYTFLGVSEVVENLPNARIRLISRRNYLRVFLLVFFPRL